jgi:hypothetical protein
LNGILRQQLCGFAPEVTRASEVASLRRGLSLLRQLLQIG